MPSCIGRGERGDPTTFGVGGSGRDGGGGALFGVAQGQSKQGSLGNSWGNDGPEFLDCLVKICSLGIPGW